MEDAGRLSASIAGEDDKFNYRRSLTLTEDEKIRFFGRMAASLSSRGGSVPEFLRKELEACDIAEDGKDNPDKWLMEAKPTPNERKFIRELHGLVWAHGQGFSKAAVHFPGVFDPILLAFIQAGEAKGDYQQVLRMYVQRMKESKELRQKIMGAFMYPLFVCAAAVCVLAVFVGYIIPQFKVFYAGLVGEGVKLPGPTQFLLDLSDFCVRWGWLVVFGWAAAVVGYRRLRQTNPQIRLKEQRMLMRMKYVGPLLLQMDCINFLRTYTMLRNAGALATDALQMAAATMRFFDLQDAVNDTVKAILGATTESIHMGLARRHVIFSPGTPFFSEFKAAEEAGNLGILDDYADLLKVNADNARDRLLQIVEPTLIFVLGIVVGLLVIALYLPLFHLVAQMAAKNSF